MASTLPESRAAVVRRLRALRALIGSWALSVPRQYGGSRQAPAPPARLRQDLDEIAIALRSLGQPSLGLLARATAAALGRLQEAPALVSTDASATLDRAVSALLLAAEVGLPPAAAVSLFPVYRSVQHLAGAERVHPADLWWPQSGLTEDPGAFPEPLAAAVDGALLLDLESALLELMREPQASGHLRLQRLCEAAAACQTPSQAQPWRFAQAVFEALAEGLLPFDPYVKRLVPRLLALARGKGMATPDGLRLRRDLMFHCAQAAGAVAGPLPPVLSRVCRSHGIEPVHDRWPAPARRASAAPDRPREVPPAAEEGSPLRPRAAASAIEGAGAAQAPPPVPGSSPTLDGVVPSLPAAADLDLSAGRPALEVTGTPETASDEAGPEPVLGSGPELAPAESSSHDAPAPRVPTLAAETLELMLPRMAPAAASDDAARHAAGGMAARGLPDLETLVAEVESIDGAVREGTSVVQRLRVLASADEVRVGSVDALGYLSRLDVAFGQIDVAARRMRAITAAATLPALIEPVDVLWIPAGIQQR